MEARKIWAFGHAEKKGMVIVSSAGETIKIKAKPSGKMFLPDPTDFRDSFLTVLEPGDLVLGVSATHWGFFEVIDQLGVSVWWMHATTLKHLLDTDAKLKMPHALIHFWNRGKGEDSKPPEHFYEYLKAADGIQELRMAVDQQRALEKLVTGDVNKLSHLQQRMGLYLLLHPDRLVGLAKSFAEVVAERFIGQVKRWGGGKFSKAEQETLNNAIETQTTDLFQRFYSDEGKQAKKDRLQGIHDQLDFFGCGIALEHARNEVERVLKTLPENKLFDGLVSDGATRIRAFVLAQMRDPRLYPNVNALLAYAGMNTRDGQKIQKRKGTNTSWNHNFRQVLCFDAPSTLFKNDKVGILGRLYRVYKKHQYLTYWELIEAINEAYRTLGGNADDYGDDDEIEGDEDAVVVPKRRKGDLSLAEVVARLKNLSNLPIIARNEAIQKTIASLVEKPDPAVLKKLLSRVGLNLQMTPKRIEQQAWSMIGTVLVKTIYYRWLEHFGLPLPLDKDGFYKAQYRHFMGSGDGINTYDPEIVLAFYEMRVEELEEERLMYNAPLPVEIEFKLIFPSERVAFALKQTAQDRLAIWKTLTKPDRKKYAEQGAFPEMKPTQVEAEEEEEGELVA